MTDETPREKPVKPVPLRVVVGGSAAQQEQRRAERAGGAEAVRQAVEAAETYSPPPESFDGGGGGGPGETRASHRQWPVTPLGINGDLFYYLDAALQLRAFHFRDHTRLGLMSLWGEHAERLEAFWPRKRQKDGEVLGFEADLCAREHMAGCAAKGVWQPRDRLRGPGAWAGNAGNLILHMGDEVWIGPPPNETAAPTRMDPGFIDGFVYPAATPGPRFSPKACAEGEKGPAAHLLRILKTWNFRRGDMDARLLLGLTGAAMIGGALAWRPCGWVTGQAGSGKSTLQHLLELVLGGALVAVSDTTAAGIWQKIGHSTYPVWVDEAEASDDNRRMEGVIRLARQASSGGLVLRGGKDHESSEFKARSCFFFSAIDMPPLETQDMQRNAIFALGPLPQGNAPYSLDRDLLRELGRRLLRRMVDGWARYQVTLDIFKAALTAVGHTSRGADQFGNLLACAWVMEWDDPPHSDDAEVLAEQLRPAEVAEIQDAGSGERRCVKWLLGAPVDPWRSGSKAPLGEWMLRAAGKTDKLTEDAATANGVLGMYGLQYRIEDKEPGFVIANFHRGLAELYEKSRWASKPSAAQAAWVQQWRRLDGARWGKAFNKTVWFKGDPGKGTFVPLDSVFADGFEPDALRTERGGDFDLRG